MTLKEVVDGLGLRICCAGDKLQHEVTGGYASDLLSDVIANSKAGNVWVTMQVHANIVAVAVLKDLAAIVLVHGRNPSDETVRRAVGEEMAILVSSLPAFETVGKLYELGVGKAT